jgi:ribosomal protein S7
MTEENNMQTVIQIFDKSIENIYPALPFSKVLFLNASFQLTADTIT